MEEEIINNMHKVDNYIGLYGTKNDSAIRLNEDNIDIRTSFFRDIDRIIYSLSYVRYLDKTQVFSITDNDHISKRMTHVQLVSKIARTIGRALNMNEDLIEAIALGHDLGHVPFGHPGETILNRLSLEYTGRYFNHNVHSVRILKDLENGGYGENITVQVLDGILCHNGEFLSEQYSPQNRTVGEFLEIYEKCYTDKDVINNLHAMTLEGCIVRISDVIGYIGRDIEDAIRLGLIDESDLPSIVKNTLGKTNREIVNTIILDIIHNSLNKPYIKMSKEVYKALEELKNFNYVNIYNKANSQESLAHYETMYRALFKRLLNDLKRTDLDSSIYIDYLNHMCKDYLDKTSDEQKVIDFIAGMTDGYFMTLYHKCTSE